MVGRAVDLINCPVLLTCSLKRLGSYLYSSLVVHITASGLQGEKPLVDRIRWVREVGKMGPKPREKDWLLGLSV